MPVPQAPIEDGTPAGAGWLAAIALVSTVGAIGLFFAGLRRVGPTAASILSTLEPVVVKGDDTLLRRVQEAKSPDEAKEILKGVPGLKVNLDREITIEFR